MKLIGEILLDNKLLTQEQLDRALSVQKDSNDIRPIGEILIEMGFINIKTLMDYLDVQLKKK